MITFLKKHDAFSGDLNKFIDRVHRSIDLDREGVFRDQSIGANGVFQKI